MSELKLTIRDIKILDLIKRFGFLREDLIAKNLGLDFSDKKVKGIFKALSTRLIKSQIISKDILISGAESYWSLGKLGADFVAGEVYGKVGLANIRQNDMVAELAIHALNIGKTIITGYEFRQQYTAEELKKIAVPSLIIDDETAIEVEFSQKTDSEIIANLTKLSNSEFKTLIFYADKKLILNRISRLKSSGQRFKFRLFTGTDILKAADFEPELSGV